MFNGELYLTNEKTTKIKQMKKHIAFVLLLFTFFGFSQTKKEYEIGILLDNKTTELAPLLLELQNEIKAVVGVDADIHFSDKNILTNYYNLQKAENQYNTLINNEVDIIIAFGVINNIVVTKQQVHRKPTILFGTVNSDLIQLKEGQQSSGIDNFTFLISSQSFNDDLKTLQELSNFKNVGIAVEKEIIEVLPLKETLDNELAALNASYTLIAYENVNDLIQQLEGIDAFYLAEGFFLNDNDIKQLSQALISKKIPSFTSTNIDDVENGLLATNQAEENIDQFFRRIALSIEAYINGTNLSELPIYLNYDNKLTVNYNTAERVGIPIKYSLIATTDFVGDFENVLSEKKYNLLEVMNDAIDRNLNLQSSKKDVELRAQDVKIAKSNYLPNITATATGTYVDPDLAEISGGQNPEYSTSGNITLDQTIFSEAANANINIQKNLKKAQQENYNTDQLNTILDASNAYFNALIVKANLQIQSQNLDVTKKNLQIAEQNFEAGQSSKSDVLRFRSELASNTQSLVEAANQLEQTYYALNQVLNNPIDFEIDVENAELEKGIFEGYDYNQLRGFLDDPTLRRPFVSFLIEEAKRNAPELKSLDYNIKATKRNIKLNGPGRFLPTLALRGQYNRNFDQGGVGAPPPPTLNSNYNVGLNLSIPIFQQNQQNINRQTAIIQRDQLEINSDNTKLSIERNVNDAVLSIINQIANIELSKVSEETAKEALELTQTSYASGAVNLVQLIDAQTNYLQAQLARANAVYNYFLSSIQLERIIGYYFLLHTEAENQQFVQRFTEFMIGRQ